MYSKRYTRFLSNFADEAVTKSGAGTWDLRTWD